jgi:DNA-binding XRE family transcriptional regulator
MPAERRYFVVRLCPEPGKENFLLLPENINPEKRFHYASQLLDHGRLWFLGNPGERERLALVIRDFAHHCAAILEENYEALRLAGVETLQSAFLGREARLAVADILGPALAASLIGEMAAAVRENSHLKLDSIWRQCLGQRGAVKLFLRSLLTMHRNHVAAIVSEAAGLAWRPRFSVDETITEMPIPLQVFSSGPSYLYVMNNLPYHALREALALRSFQSSEDSPWPTAKIKRGSTQGQAQLFPVELEINPYREPDVQQQLVNRMWNQVSELNDLDADVLDMMSALWIQQARDPNDFARITVKQLLEMRGLKPKSGEGGRASGFRPEQKQQLFQAIQHISSLFLLIYDLELPKGDSRQKERREIRSRAFVITDVMGNRTASGMTMEIDEFLVRPGVLFGHFLFGPGRQIALLSSKAIQYDRIRQDWEKRLSRYFSWVWRNDASNDRPVRSFLVRTLLEAAGKTVDPEHPKRTRDRLEKALNQLRGDHVIESWQWDRNMGSPFREPRNWQDYWMEWGLRIAMPEVVQKHYQNIAAPPANPTSFLPAGTQTGRMENRVSEASTLAARLFAWRKDRSHSQAEMAAMLGITQSYYSHLERGTRQAPDDTRRRIELLLQRPV